jgi:hypothetical protein
VLARAQTPGTDLAMRTTLWRMKEANLRWKHKLGRFASDFVCTSFCVRTNVRPCKQAYKSVAEVHCRFDLSRASIFGSTISRTLDCRPCKRVRQKPIAAKITRRMRKPNTDNFKKADNSVAQKLIYNIFIPSEVLFIVGRLFKPPGALWLPPFAPLSSIYPFCIPTP